MKLTERKIERLAIEANKRDRLVFDDEQRGLAVRITASGGKSYLCQYRLHGHNWRVPLGACAAISLAKAREAAAIVMGDVAKGENPADKRKKAAIAERVQRLRHKLTLRVLIADWASEHLSERRKSYAAEAVRALHKTFADHLDQPAEALGRAAVVGALDAIKRRWKTKGGKRKGSAMAGRTAAYGRAAFAWAIKRGTLRENPFAALPVAKSIEARDRVLNDGELAEIWRDAGEAAEPYGAIVRMLILTGQRRSEVAGMIWAELSEDLATWTIPGARTKNGAPHIVPLSEPTRELLRQALPEGKARRAMQDLSAKGALVFPGERQAAVYAGWSKSKTELDAAIMRARGGKEASPMQPWRLHDLRRTLATGLQRLGVRLEVTEAVLNHVSGSRAGIVGVYQRHDWAAEKRAALDAWAAHVMALAEGRAPAGKVVRLRAGAAASL